MEKSTGTGRPKIALVVPALTGGGGVPTVARFLLDIGLRDGRFEFLVVSLVTSSKNDLSVRLLKPSTWFSKVSVRRASWEGISFFEVGAFATELEFQRYRRRKALDNILSDCNLIQVVCGTPAIANAVFGLGMPVSIQVATRAVFERLQRDSLPIRLADHWRKAMTKLTNLFDNYALMKANAIQVENPLMLEYVKALNSERNFDLRYAPPGVNSQIFCPLKKRTPQKNPYILCVARFDDPRKNIVLLLDAFALLPPPIRDRTTLLLAGSTGPPTNFWKNVKKLELQDKVTFIKNPTQRKLVQLYQSASVFALTSAEEGLGMVLLEAMSCGVPVVSTACGGPNSIISDGEDGFLVPLNDARSLSSQLGLLLEDVQLNLVMGENARATIESRFEEEVAGKEFLDTWVKLLDTSRV